MIVDAQDKCDVAVVDLPAQFLQTEMIEVIYLKVPGPLALLLVEHEPSIWKKYLRKENGKPIIYVLCNKSIYGTLNAEILAYKKLTKYFVEWGFKMNPYEPCLWDKDIDGKQFTIIFHVDDLKLLHVDPSVVTMIINKLKDAYTGNSSIKDELTITQGKVRDYLGIPISYETVGEVHITMYDYLSKLTARLSEDMIGYKKTPAADYLFKTNDGGELLNQSHKNTFHQLTAQTLWLSQRSRPDVQLPTGFMCTRVKKPDKTDWKKLSHEMKYLQYTRHLPLILCAVGNGVAIWIEASHAVHADMKGHVGTYASMGTGAVISSANQIKLNTTSSTETEIVAVGEKLPK